MRYLYNLFILLTIFTVEFAFTDSADTVKRETFKFEDTDTVTFIKK